MADLDPALVETVSEALRQHENTGITRRLTELQCTCGVWTEDPAQHQAEAVLAAVASVVRQETVEELARKFQWGGWTILTAPPPAGSIPSLALGQRVTDWIRAQQRDPATRNSVRHAPPSGANVVHREESEQ